MKIRIYQYKSVLHSSKSHQSNGRLDKGVKLRTKHFYSCSTKILLILLVLTIAIQAQNNNKDTIVNLVEKSIYEYFSREFNLTEQAISVGFKRIPELKHLQEDQQLRLSNHKGRYEPGYQTVWLNVYENNILKKKFPVSFDITIKQKVVVAKRKINRGQKLTADLVEITEQSVGSKLNNALISLDEAYKRQSSRFIKPGVIITHDMVKLPPAVKNGEKVELKVNSGNLSISTAGIVKEDGVIGEEIKVICESTGKKLEGIIKSPELVVITTNGYIK